MKHHEVVAAIIVHQGKVLCMQRGQTCYDYTSYKWEFPGGKIEPGETHQEALRREVAEELQMDITVGDHLITVEHTYADFSVTLHCYLCTAASPSLVMTEHNAFKWLLPAEMSSLDWVEADIEVCEACERI